MTSITINLPDELARQAAMAGLFDARHFERLIRASLRSKAKADLQAIWKKLESDPIAPLSDAELEAGAESLSVNCTPVQRGRELLQARRLAEFLQPGQCH